MREHSEFSQNDDIIRVFPFLRHPLHGVGGNSAARLGPMLSERPSSADPKGSDTVI